jgi:Uma2 family endonuclease
MVTKSKEVALRREAEQRIPMSYEEWLSDLPEDIHTEWVNGEAILFMPPNTRHQDIADFLLILIRLFVELRSLGRVFSAPYEMRLAEQKSAREPDILFIAAENRERITSERLLGPADLAVEIISPESVTRDRVEKWREYQEAGVREYWIIDPRPGQESAEFWRLDEYGRYQAIPLDEGGIFRSQVLPGFWLNTHWLWAEELPNAMHSFAQIVGPDALYKVIG